MRVVDLSKPIVFNKNDPSFMQVKIKHKPHWIARWLIRGLGLPFKLMPKDFVGWADDTIKDMGVHSTTHIDAPWHYGPMSYTDEGAKRALTIDEMPLEKGIGSGVKIDMTHKLEGEVITAQDLEEALLKTGSVVSEGDIVLIQTGRDRFMGTKSFWKKGTGMSAEATLWLIERGCTVMGIDQWGWDLPFHYQISQSKRDQDKDLFWEGHRIGQHNPYWQMEQLTNLESLPNHGFKVCVFPLKIVGASAAPARVVALIEVEPSE